MTTMQEFFDKTIETLATMPERSMISEGGELFCAYKTQAGLHCGVGMHLPDGPWMAHRGDVGSLINTCPAMKAPLAIDGVEPERVYLDEEADFDHLFEDNEVLTFWQEIQNLHDDVSHWGSRGFIYWEAARHVAVRFGLVFTQPMSKYLSYDEMSEEQRRDIVEIVLVMAREHRKPSSPLDDWFVVKAVERPVLPSYRVVDKPLKAGDTYFDTVVGRWLTAHFDAPDMIRPVRMERLDDYTG